ncbi:MAG TPA: ABC transporter permease [Firmicutes bacterium]|nr:ABC transporter permease [Bacillota bacterium]
MSRYFGRKLAIFFLTILIANLLTFVILNVLPGDPALLMLGTEGSPEAYARLRRELKLDRPVLVRYCIWLADFVRGEWGISARYSLPVKELVGTALPFSLLLAVLAVGLSVVVAVPAGMAMVIWPSSAAGRMLSLASQVGMGLPQFWVGLLLIEIFAVRWHILPAGGNSGWASFVLPVFTLALPRAAILSRMVRTGLNQALQQDYIRTARAKGLSARAVYFKHGLRNGSLAVSTIAGLQFSQLFAGTIVVEQIFGLPGMGRLLLAGVLQRDVPLVQALVLLVVLMVLVFNLFFDLWLGFLDPRLRYE